MQPVFRWITTSTTLEPFLADGPLCGHVRMEAVASRVANRESYSYSPFKKSGQRCNLP